MGAWGRQEEIEGMSWKLRGYQYSNRPAKKIHTVPSIQLRFGLLMYPVNPVWLEWGQRGCMDRGTHLLGTRERSFLSVGYIIAV